MTQQQHDFDTSDEGNDDWFAFNCTLCPGVGTRMGTLGTRTHYRCRDCGSEWSHQQGDV